MLAGKWGARVDRAHDSQRDAVAAGRRSRLEDPLLAIAADMFAVFDLPRMTGDGHVAVLEVALVKCAVLFLRGPGNGHETAGEFFGACGRSGEHTRVSPCSLHELSDSRVL